MSEALGKDIISEIEELLEEGKYGKESELLNSEDNLLNNDSDFVVTNFKDSEALLDVSGMAELNEVNDSDMFDVVLENDTEITENDSEELLEKEINEVEILEKDSEVSEKDTEEAVLQPKKKKKDESSSRYRPLNLPLARIKQIIKMDPEVHLAGSDAVFLIAKATELFIELLSKDAYAITASSKKKTIQKKDVDAAIMNTDCLVFLDGAMDF